MGVLSTPFGLAPVIATAISYNQVLDTYEDFTPVVGGKHYIAFADGTDYTSVNPVQITVKARAGRIDYARKQQTKAKRSISISVPTLDSFNQPTFSTVRIEMDVVGGGASIVNHLKSLALGAIDGGAMDPFWQSGVAA